jgi:hypothetical protein
MTPSPMEIGVTPASQFLCRDLSVIENTNTHGGQACKPDSNPIGPMAQNAEHRRADYTAFGKWGNYPCTLPMSHDLLALLGDKVDPAFPLLRSMPANSSCVLTLVGVTRHSHSYHPAARWTPYCRRLPEDGRD